jgi:hypothetical protein
MPPPMPPAMNSTEWCVTSRLLGRISSARIQRSSGMSMVRFGVGKMSRPAAGISIAGSVMMKSGSPNCHPSVSTGGLGSSAGLPRGAPASTHFTIVSICGWLRRASLANVPCAGSANHGGICRFETFSLIDRAQGRTSS